MPTTIYKSLSFDQLPKSNLIDVKEGDTISLVTYKLPKGANHFDCDYIYSHERLGTITKTNEDGSFTAKMESISGNVTRDYDFTVSQLNRVTFAKMAHVIYKL